MPMRCFTVLLAALVLPSLLAPAAVTVTLEDFESLALSPWGAAAGTDMQPVAEAHAGQAAARITIRPSGEGLGLIRPIDIPREARSLSLWVKGAPGCGMAIEAVFKDRQGFTWYAGGKGVGEEGWKQLTWDVTPANLRPDWRLGWWRDQAKNDRRIDDLTFEMTFPLRFVGFKIHGDANRPPATILIDDLQITGEDAGTYVHVPQSVVLVPQASAFPLVIAQGSPQQLAVRVISRNDVPVQAEPLRLAVPGGASRVDVPLRFETPGMYRVEITGDGIAEPLQREVQAISATIGPEAFTSLDRQPRPFTRDISRSPYQTQRRAWEDDASKPMAMYVSELSPAWLLRNNQTPRYTLFSGLEQWGLGAPTRMAIPTGAGTQVVVPGRPVDARQMSRSWILVWFTGARGWEDWDAPYLVVLQHKPTRITLDENGLTLDFADRAGYLAVLPLYGGYKPPQPGKDLFVRQRLAPADVLPHTWARALPPHVVDRCDWWARVMKAYPVNCDEQFSIDAANDDVVVRSTFEYLMIEDDWGTEPLKLAPIPYVLGNCVWGKTFPVAFDEPVHDPVYPTNYGPYMGVENADGYTYRMRVLQYVHEVEDIRVPGDGSPAVRAAVDAIERYASSSALQEILQPERHKEPNICWGVYNHQRWQSSNLLYTDDLGVRVAGQIARQRFVGNQIYYRPQYAPADPGVGREYLFFSGPGFGFQGDGGKISMDSYYTAWLYGYATGDYQLLADRWEDVISRLNCLPFTMSWARVGRDGIAEGGDEAPPPMGMARVAYAIGDMDTYAYACYLFARELTHHYVKVGVGIDYMRQFQPINPLVNVDWMGKDRWPKAGPLPQRANVTNMWGETAGWVIGGPPDDKPIYHPSVWDAVVPGRDNKKRSELPDVIPWSYYGSGQWVQKWSRFDAEDVFRFYHDNALEACRSEFDTWRRVEFAGLPRQQYPNVRRGDQDGYPSSPWRLMQLRADVLHETDEQIAALFPPERWGNPDQTFYQAIVRSATPRGTVRIIPKAGEPTPFQPGIQRDCVANPSWDNPVQTPAGIVDDRSGRGSQWPAPAYYYARPPKPIGGGFGDRWSFGYITDGRPSPSGASKERCNWVLDVYTFE